MHTTIATRHYPENAERPISSTYVSLLISIFFVLFYNHAFFSEIIDLIDYTNFRGILFIINISLVLWLCTVIIISAITLPYLVKPLFPVLLITAASVAYFMDTYGVVIHRLMIQNVVETDLTETKNLISINLILYIVALGILPSIVILKIKIGYDTFKRECWRKIKTIGIAFISSLALILSMSMDYASFFRNHKNIRQMANPANFIYASVSFATTSKQAIAVKPIENDATINSFGKAQAKPTLFILVLGETARADHFGINGYTPDTTPLLFQQKIINFPNVTSCGTETAVSVPCMFSTLGRADYSDAKAKSQQGLLDVIAHAGISVLWRDNNSSCKGTCDRVAYEDVQHLQIPDLCNERECLDEVLLHLLDEKVAPVTGNKMIVLHQKGSHGPDYYDRYPREKEFFVPVCKTNQLHQCSGEELINAYDNTIRYTDYFLNETIEWLKKKISSTIHRCSIFLITESRSGKITSSYMECLTQLHPKSKRRSLFFSGYQMAMKRLMLSIPTA
jgi:lipid A ethanolaminephosphotransferase